MTETWAVAIRSPESAPLKDDENVIKQKEWALNRRKNGALFTAKRELVGVSR